MAERGVPTTGQVIMIASVAVGWVVLFAVNLVQFEPTAGWWVRACIAGILGLGAIVLAVSLYRRRAAAQDRPPG